jgi:hypothetical protein
MPYKYVLNPPIYSMPYDIKIFIKPTYVPTPHTSHVPTTHKVVYEFFLRFIVSSEVNGKVAKRYVDQAFIRSWIELFDAEDPRERDYVKTGNTPTHLHTYTPIHLYPYHLYTTISIKPIPIPSLY